MKIYQSSPLVPVHQSSPPIVNSPGVDIKVWLSKFVRVWSNINALSADSADHATSCNAHIPARCIPLCHKNCARVARPSLPVLMMQYIQHCGGSGLVHETILMPE